MSEHRAEAERLERQAERESREGLQATANVTVQRALVHAVLSLAGVDSIAVQRPPLLEPRVDSYTDRSTGEAHRPSCASVKYPPAGICDCA